MAYQPEIEKLQRRYDEDPARHFAQLAEAFRKEGRLEEALAILHEHLASRPNYVSGLIVLGRCLLDQKNDADARLTFERVIAVDAEHIIALRALGDIGERTGDAAGARAWYRRLLDIDPMNDEAVAALARLPEGAEAPAPAAGAQEPVPVAHSPAPAVELVPQDPAPPVEEPRTGAFAGPDLTEAETLEIPSPQADDLIIERTSAEQADAAASAAAWDADLAEGPGAGAPSPFAALDGDETPRERTIAFDDVPAGEAASVPPEEEVRGTAAEGFAFEAFDESLGWDAGERVSQQISADDLAAAETAHEDELSAPVQGLPGLEAAAPPTTDEVGAIADAGPVEGLQEVDFQAPGEPLEGLETGDALLGAPEPTGPTGGQAEPAVGGPAEEGERGSLAGLPVFFPEDEAKEPLRVEAEPEPVVTETMAELYVRQGLMDEARETYRQLVAHRPLDRRLVTRLAELDAAAPSRDARMVYAASVTGGQSSREFLGDVLAGRATAEPHAEPTASAGASGGGHVADVATAPPPEAPEPMDVAFADEAPEPEVGGSTVPKGEPTQPAPDELSLAAIFGEAPPPAARPPAATVTPKEERDQSAGGFSFDEFFAGKAPAPGPPPASESEEPPSAPPRDTLADDEGDDAFRDWLKGLKS